MKIRVLKTKPECLASVRGCVKTFELRKDDRGFEAGDLMAFTDIEGNPYAGMWPIEHILRDVPEYGLKKGWRTMSIKPYLKR